MSRHRDDEYFYKCVHCAQRASHVTPSFTSPGDWDGFAYCEAHKPAGHLLTVEEAEKLDDIVAGLATAPAPKGVN